MISLVRDYDKEAAQRSGRVVENKAGRIQDFAKIGLKFNINRLKEHNDFGFWSP